jgi:hypothetical protein
LVYTQVYFFTLKSRSYYIRVKYKAIPNWGMIWHLHKLYAFLALVNLAQNLVISLLPLNQFILYIDIYGLYMQIQITYANAETIDVGGDCESAIPGKER